MFGEVIKSGYQSRRRKIACRLNAGELESDDEERRC